MRDELEDPHSEFSVCKYRTEKCLNNEYRKYPVAFWLLRNRHYYKVLNNQAFHDFFAGGVDQWLTVTYYTHLHGKLHLFIDDNVELDVINGSDVGDLEQDVLSGESDDNYNAQIRECALWQYTFDVKPTDSIADQNTK